MKSHYKIIILGGGTGGIMTAAQLRRKAPKLDIGIVEPSEKHYYQPAWTLVGGGTYHFKNTVRSEQKYIPRNVDWIKQTVIQVDPDNNTIELDSGSVVGYDILVVSTGLKMDLDKLPGLKDTIGQNNVCSNYIDPDYTWQVIQKVKSGNALFTQAPGAIKCGGAPQKIAYLAEDYFHKQHIRDNINVIYAFPGGVVFGVEPFKSRLYEICAKREVILKHKYKIVRIDGPKKKAYFELPADESKNQLTKNDPKNKVAESVVTDNVVEIEFEMLHLAPPQSPQDFVQQSTLAFSEGPDKGYIDVDHESLQHNKYPNVFALGDNAALPTAKTGAAIRKQAPVVVDRIIALLDNSKPLLKGYDGYSSCPIVTGYGKMLLAEFGYNNVRMSDPTLSKIFDTSKDSRSMWILKKYGLPYLYWNHMLRGKM